MPDTPDVGFQFGVEGDQSLLSVIKQLREEMRKVKQEQDSLASSANFLKRAFEGLAAGAATYELVRFAEKVADGVIEIGKLSQKTGASTQALSVYQKAARDAGVSQEALSTGLVRLSRALFQLEQGGAQAATAFHALGLSQRDFVGLNTDQKMLKVVEAFGRLKDGTEKAAVAQQLFGRGGAELIPLMNDLSGGGFAKMAEKAAELGIVLDGSLYQAVLRTKAAVEDLKDSATGAMRQLEAGLLPSLADTINGIFEQVRGSAGNGFRAIGEWMGGLIKSTVVGWEELFAHGRGLLEKMGAIAREAAMPTGELDTKFKEIDDRVAKSIESYNLAVYGRDQSTKPPRPQHEAPGDLSTHVRELTAGLQARAAAETKAAQEELKIYQALGQQRDELDKISYENGLLSLEQYNARRREEAEKQTAAEQTAIEKQVLAQQNLLAGMMKLPAPINDAERAARKKEAAAAEEKIDTLSAQYYVVGIKGETKLAKLEQDRHKAEETQQRQRLEFEKQLAEAEGNRARAAQIQNRLDDERAQREHLGNPAELAALQQARGLRAQAGEGKTGFEAISADADERRMRIQEMVAEGRLSQLQAERAIRTIYGQEVPELQRQVDLIRQTATLAGEHRDMAGNADMLGLQQELNREADQLQGKLDKDKAAIGQLTEGWQAFQRAVESGAQESLNEFFAQQLEQAKSLSAAFRALAQDIARVFERYAGQQIAQRLTGMIFPHRQGQQQAQALTAAQMNQTAGATMATAAQQMLAAAQQMLAAAQETSAQGGTGTSGGFGGEGSLGDMFAGSETSEGGGGEEAAEMVAMAAGARGGYVVGYRAGGYVAQRMSPSISTWRAFGPGGSVRGPGSSTSDSIPSVLSDGEYVVKASAVRAVGLPTMEAINRGAFLPPLHQPAPISSYTARHYAGGGPVFRDDSGSGSGATAHAVTIGLREGLVLEEMQSSEGGRIVVEHIANRPRQVAKALQRG